MLKCDTQSLKEKETKSAIKSLNGVFKVENEKGLHTRPSAELVKCACRFKANINLILNETVVNAKSILGILMLAACKGTKISIQAEGEDAQEAIEAIQQLAKKKFYINY